MRFLSIITSSLLATLTAAAAVNVSEIFVPVSAEESRDIQKRQPGGVYICKHANWVDCGYAKQPWDLCIRLDSPWWKSISSIGPDQYNMIVAYEDYNCGSSAKLGIFHPGHAHLGTVGWNDRIGSFRVFQTNGPNCIRENDFDRPLIAAAVDCNSCCEGCTRAGYCCPINGVC